MSPIRHVRLEEAAPTHEGTRIWSPPLLLLLPLIVIAGFVRFSQLDRHEPWIDENCTFFVVNQFPQWGMVGEHWRSEVAHLPYVGLLTLWSAAWGDTIWHLRALSAVVGTLDVLVLAILAGAMAGRYAALVAALLMAVHPLHIHYSQEARVYALWLLAISCCMYALFRAARETHLKWWVIYAALALFAILVHYYSLFWLPATFTAALVAGSMRRFIRQWALTHLCLAPLLVAVLWLFVRPLRSGGPRPWLHSIWLEYPPLLAIPRSFWAMLPAGGYPDYLGTLTFAHENAAAIIGGPAALLVAWVSCAVAASVLIGLIPARFRTLRAMPSNDSSTARTEPHVDQCVIWLLVMSFLFLVSCWAYSYFVEPVYVIGRYDLPALPAVMVTLAIALSSLFNGPSFRHPFAPWMGIIAVCSLTGSSMLTNDVARAAPANADMTLRAQRIAATIGPRDLVISLGMYRWFIAYAWDQEGIQTEIVSFPAWHDGQLCWDDPEAERRDPQRVNEAVEHTMTMIQSALSTGRRVWLLAQGEPAGARWDVDRHLFAALTLNGLTITPVDEWVGLAAIGF